MLKLKSRKIQKIRDSYYINLPVLFIRNHELDKQDLIDIELASDNSLILKPRK